MTPMTRLIIPTLVALMVLVVSACESIESNIDQLVRDGSIHIDTSESPDFDFKLHIRNSVFLSGWDGRQAKDRQITAEYLLGPQCPNMKKVSEDVIKLGDALTFGGGPALEYITKWKC